MTRPPLDPDPRYVDEDDLWDPQANAWVPRQSGVFVLLGGIVIGVVLGLAFGIVFATQVLAAPRSAALDDRGQASRPASPWSDPLPSGAPRDGKPVEGPRAEASREAPAPAGGVGAPITEPASIEGGLASWYDDGPGLYGAVPTWSFGDRPYPVEVCAGGHCVTVTIRDFCGCPGDRIIDLSPEAFGQLAPLSRGILPVTVEDATAPGITAPPTDVDP